MGRIEGGKATHILRRYVLIERNRFVEELFAIASNTAYAGRINGEVRERRRRTDGDL